MLRSDVYRRVSRREGGRNVEPNPARLDRIVARFGLLGEAGSDLLAPGPPGDGYADPDPRRIHPPGLEGAAEHLDGAWCDDDGHGGDATRARG